jgi:putative flippase GtrA
MQHGSVSTPRDNRHWASLLGRHQLGSFAATLVDFTVMTLAVEGLRASAELGTATGALVGAVTNFTLGRHWIFRRAGGSASGQAVRYAAVSLASLVCNTLGEYILHERMGVQYQIARVIVSIGVSIAWNFPMQRYFVFGEPEPLGGDPQTPGPASPALPQDA